MTINNIYTKTVTIANGASLSGAIFLENFELCGIITPAAWTTAALSFQGAYDAIGGTYYNLFSGATELSYAAVTASKWVTFDPALFFGVSYLKVRSGTSGTPVNQAGGDIVTLVMRRIL